MLLEFSDIQWLKVKSSQDDRGRFIKLFDHSLLDGLSFQMKQMNFVESKSKFTLRGLHYQTGKYAEAKIFRVTKGSIQLVFFDTRKSSPTFQKTGSIILDKPEQACLIPRGYATGYLTLTEDTSVLYMSDNDYEPSMEMGIRPDDPILGIQWADSHYLLSEKDKNWKDWR